MNKDMYENLRSGKSIPLLNEKDIKNLQTPIGKAVYLSTIQKKPLGRPRKNEEDKANPHDRLTCEICGGEFFRNHRQAHKKTKVHKAYENMNRKLSQILLDKKDE